MAEMTMDDEEERGAGYVRVIPRDLFNEANLLKCYGQVYLELERGNYPHAELVYVDEDTKNGFIVCQDRSSGALLVDNVELRVRGRVCHMERPLNARQHPYPLYVVFSDDEDIAVFDNEGHFTPEMKRLLSGGDEEPD